MTEQRLAALCDALAATGSGAGWGAMLFLLAVVLVAVGVAIRRRGAVRASVWGGILLAVCIASIVAVAPASSARAACPAPSPAQPNSLSVTQTSVNEGLSPITGPSAIVGLVTNNGPDETFVTVVEVSIGAVVTSPSALAGSCDASDYLVTHPRMIVDRRLDANGGSAVFRGALIEFVDKPTNQDACKNAVVELLYAAR